MATTKARTSTGAKVRKRDTGEAGNRGEFGTDARTDADVTVPQSEPGSGPRAGKEVEIDLSARIDESAVVGDGTVVGADVTIGPGVILGEGVVVGDGSTVSAGTMVDDGARLVEAVEVGQGRSEAHTSELQSRGHLVCRLQPEKQ